MSFLSFPHLWKGHDVVSAVLLCVLVVGAFVVPLAARAAPLNYNASTTVSLASPAIDFSIVASSSADTLLANATSVVVTISSSTGGSFSLTSVSRDISVTSSSAGGTVSRSCTSGIASTTITQSTGSSNYTIVPTTSTCAIVISGITVSSVGAYSAIISWTTNYPANSSVSYGTTSAYGSVERGVAYVTSHSLLIDNNDFNLLPQTRYHYAVNSTAGNTSATSSDATFDTGSVSGVGGGVGGGGGSQPPAPPPPSPSTPTSTTPVATSTPIVLAPATTTPATTPALSPNVLMSGVAVALSRKLSQGVSGDDVTALQRLLIKEGLLSGSATGYFGPLTRQAVIRFQEKYASEILTPNGLTAGSGIVGPSTRAKVNQLLRGSMALISVTSPDQVTKAVIVRKLQVGVRGDDVKALQELLLKEGVYPDGLVTGYFGNLTKQAVIRFQEKYASEILTPNGLTAGTGAVGPSTRNKVNQLLK